MVDAHRRGVHVQVIANRRVSKDFRAVQKLTKELGTDRSRSSFVLLSQGSQRGVRIGGDGKVHQKTWTFTRVGDTRHVVVTGSANLSYYSTRQYSDMWVFAGRTDVWRAFDRDFREQTGEPEAPGVPVRAAARQRPGLLLPRLGRGVRPGRGPDRRSPRPGVGAALRDVRLAQRPRSQHRPDRGGQGSWRSQGAGDLAAHRQGHRRDAARGRGGGARSEVRRRVRRPQQDSACSRGPARTAYGTGGW
ncbi:phospholipase D-like domain-containing protein [Nocardioides convexus]|uniref:phospholipase D-like domain-containing protein n=1 Tax=Nocardioides convexus TaxID=2712224 RepID=UPI002418A44E|nr:phospholipase D-like domain-containing protein [Nocardioides convexus]